LTQGTPDARVGSVLDAVVQAEHEGQLQSILSLDTRSGVLLATSALVVTLPLASATSSTEVSSVSLISAGLAAVLSLVCILIRPSYSIDPEALARRYAGKPVEDVQEIIRNTRIDMYRRAAPHVGYKSLTHLVAVLALAVSILDVVIRSV
jgi:hypothetical protein